MYVYANIILYVFMFVIIINVFWIYPGLLKTTVYMNNYKLIISL